MTQIYADATGPTGPGESRGAVALDTPCRTCGYNLRGLSRDGQCPECGAPVSQSLGNHLLRHSDPAWLDTLARGAGLILLSIVAGIVLGLLVGIGVQVAVWQGAGNAAGTVALLGGGLGLLVGAVQVYGAWLLTEPDPSGVGEDQYGTVRKVVRVALIVGLVSSGLNLLANTLPPEPRQVVALAAGALGLVQVAGFFAGLLYLRRLAMRVPDPDAASRAKLLLYAIPICYAVLALVGVAAALTARQSGARVTSGAFVGFGCLGGIAGLALFVFSIMALLLLNRLRGDFKEQADVARDLRAGGGPSAPVGA